MINEIDLVLALSQYGVVEYCGYNNEENSTYIIAMSNINTDKLTLDQLSASYVNVEFINNVPSTLEMGIYKIQYDNFPNII